MSDEIEIQAAFLEGMQFELKTENGQNVTLDGNYQVGASPMQMILCSLAGCSGMSVISVLQKKHQEITAYEILVRGKRANTYPLVFTEIFVEHRFRGHGIEAKAVQRAIELAETRYCPVSIMLSQAVKIEHTFTITEA